MKRLYFIADGAGHVKIGTSQDPRKRLKQFQTSSPRPLTLLYDVDCEEGDERGIHLMFAAERAVGEWFHISRGMRDWLTWATETRHPGPIQDAIGAWFEDAALEQQYGAFVYRCHEVGC